MLQTAQKLHEYDLQQLRHADPCICRELDADEAGPRFWTDFCKATLHPNSVVQLSAPWSQGGGDGVARPLGWGEGQKLLEAAEPADDVADRLRRFAEECDRLQVQLLICMLDSCSYITVT